MEDLEVVLIQIEVWDNKYQEDNTDVTDISVMWPRWGDSTRLYDNHPARMGSFHQVVQYDSRIFSGIFYHAVRT